VLWGYAVANLPVATSTSLLYLVPAVAVLIAFVWLGEALHASQLLGGLVVLTGVVLVGQGDRLRRQRARIRAGRRRTTATVHARDPGVAKRALDTSQPTSPLHPSLSQQVS
jgi:EamA-like transporter family